MKNDYTWFGRWHVYGFDDYVDTRESRNSLKRQYARKRGKVWKLAPLERKTYTDQSGMPRSTRKALRLKKGRK